MVNKGVLAKNYYIVPETVADYGTNIYNMMAETDQALEEASGIIGEISSLAERVPSQARCGTLLEACASAQAEVRSVDFLSYGQRVKQGLQNLLDHNQYITNNFIKTMGTYTEKMCGFGMECRRLADLITYTTEYKEQINIIQSMTEVMRSMNGGNSLASAMEITEKPYPNDVIYSDSEDTDSPAGFMEFIVRNRKLNYDASMTELTKFYESGLITNEQYRYFQYVVNMASNDSIPSSVVEALRVQAFNSFYKEEIATIEKYINQTTFSKLGWSVDDDFIEKMRRLMLQYGLTDEKSIILFLITVTYECKRGGSMTEDGGPEHYENLSYTMEERGAGLIQLSLESNQENFLRFITGHISDEEVDFSDLLGNMSRADYIATYYPIESALWYWCVYDEKITFNGVNRSINYSIAYYGSDTNLYAMFIASQCVVNSSGFRPRGCGRMFLPDNEVYFENNIITLNYYENSEKLSTDVSKLPDNLNERIVYYDTYIPYFIGLLEQ